MPHEHQSRREILDALQSVPALAELVTVQPATDGQADGYVYELDLEVTVYGRVYNGKRVGPYVRLLTYEPGETIICEGDWGGNTFFIVVAGQPEVFLNERLGVKVSEIPPGRQFGELSVLAGVPRSATVKAPAHEAVQVLEIQRPALRLLRKLPSFSQHLDASYSHHGHKAAWQELAIPANYAEQFLALADGLSEFHVLAKNHLLFRQGTPIESLYLIKEGWLKRQRSNPLTNEEQFDFLGQGYCFGLAGIATTASWPYTVTLVGRSEVLAIPLAKLRRQPALADLLTQELGRFAPPPLAAESAPVAAARATQQQLIQTGLAESTNLLVMDLERCVRCGRCSLACHQIHGRSRLVRKGIQITRLSATTPPAQQALLVPAVCLHCQDPECLTGCPTGAISRLNQGHIDIHAATCIGCGDCAANCPYQAITMAPRETPPATLATPTRWPQLFKLKPAPPPPAVTQTDELVAVKCNLCSNTSLNPAGSSHAVYGCEENCPTDALVRINPQTYFREIGQIEGLAYLNQTHAVGRNVRQAGTWQRRWHLVGTALLLLLTLLGLLAVRRFGYEVPLAGGLNLRQLTGLTGLGCLAGVLAYAVRRQIFKRRAGALRYWMLAHVYLGSCSVVVLLLHSGTQLGGVLTTALAWAFDAVLLTGFIGLLCYWRVPRWLTQLEGEPLLLEDLETRRAELRDELTQDCQTVRASLQPVITKQVLPQVFSLRNWLRQYTKREQLAVWVTAAQSNLADTLAAQTTVSERAALLRIIEVAATLQRVEALLLLHRCLKAWLPPHVAATALFLGLLLLHLLQVFYAAH